MIDVTSDKDATRRTYEEFNTSIGIISLCNEDMQRLAFKLTEFEMVLMFRIIPGMSLAEARRISQHYKYNS